jgi:hypothetical protein
VRQEHAPVMPVVDKIDKDKRLVKLFPAFCRILITVREEL